MRCLFRAATRVAPRPQIAEAVDVFGIVVVVDHAVEERGGRQLLLVSGHHQLASAINRPDGIPRVYMRNLVKDDDIEWKLGRFQVRADRERTHHPARLQSDESIRPTSEKRSQRQVPLPWIDFGGVARLDPPATSVVARLNFNRRPEPSRATQPSCIEPAIPSQT